MATSHKPAAGTCRKVLVTGARGMLGTDLCPVLAQSGWQVVPADLAELDLTDREATLAFVREHRPAVIINCAAYTAVDEAESEQELAFRVNRDGARNAAEAAAAVGAALVHISTDYVFDGEKEGPYREDDPPNPLSAYGRSKLAGDRAVQETLAEHCIIRSAWLHGVHGSSFPRAILDLAREGKPLRVVTDQRGSPTYTAHLAQALAAIIAQPRFGTYHAVSVGSCTRYELAREVLRAAGIHVQVGPATTAEFPRPAARPANSVLDASRLAEVFGLRLPRWEQGVAEFVARWQREQAGPRA